MCRTTSQNVLKVEYFFQQAKVLSSSKLKVACNTVLALKIANGTHDSASYDLNRLDTETKGIYTFFTLDLVSNF